MANATTSSFCHVFLSHRGETRDKFTCFLYDGLKADGFQVFLDKETIHAGDEVASRIVDGIRGSMSAIVVVSEKYAHSKWCLDELVLILDRKRNSNNYFIIPIFYQVEPADIKFLMGSFGAALDKHEKRYSKDQVNKWREALVQLAHIAGEQVHGRTESRFIQNIVPMFRKTLMKKYPEYSLPIPIDPSTHCKVVVYICNKDDDHIGSAGCIVRMLLAKNQVSHVVKNCYNEPMNIAELEELVGKDVDNIIFPMVLSNGKDVCGNEEVEGFEDCENVKHVLRTTLVRLKQLKKGVRLFKGLFCISST